MEDHKRLVRAHYGEWAATYGDPDDDGWFSWVRARETRLVHRMLDLREGSSILDVGCGSGVYARELHERGHVVWAVDFAPEMVDRVRGQVDRCEQADVEQLRLGRRFNRVLCLGVLEWVGCPESAMRRLAEHLEPGGRLIILVPRTGPGGWIYQHQKRKHGLSARLYSPGGLRRLGEDVGLQWREQVTPCIHNFIMAFEAPPITALSASTAKEG